jgi:hypothetical protein
MVTADNYVRAESDIQMKGYIESFGMLWEVPPQPEAYDVKTRLPFGATGTRCTHLACGI